MVLFLPEQKKAAVFGFSRYFSCEVEGFLKIAVFFFSL